MALFGKKRERLSDEDLLAEDEVVETSVRPEPVDGEPVAALLEHRESVDADRIGIILSGGNVDLEQLPW